MQRHMTKADWLIGCITGITGCLIFNLQTSDFKPQNTPVGKN
jgi:hypothetical protein